MISLSRSNCNFLILYSLFIAFNVKISKCTIQPAQHAMFYGSRNFFYFISQNFWLTIYPMLVIDSTKLKNDLKIRPQLIDGWMAEKTNAFHVSDEFRWFFSRMFHSSNFLRYFSYNLMPTSALFAILNFFCNISRAFYPTENAFSIIQIVVALLNRVTCSCMFFWKN